MPSPRRFPLPWSVDERGASSSATPAGRRSGALGEAEGARGVSRHAAPPLPAAWSVEGRGKRKAPEPTGAKQKNLRIRRVLFDAVGPPIVIADSYHAWRAARREGTD
jgi:hypothetical protein